MHTYTQICARTHTHMHTHAHTRTHTHMTLKASICCILFVFCFLGGGGVGSWGGMDFVLWNGYYDFFYYTGNFNHVFIYIYIYTYSYCGDTFHDIDVTQVIIFPLMIFCATNNVNSNFHIRNINTSKTFLRHYVRTIYTVMMFLSHWHHSIFFHIWTKIVL